MNKLKFLREDHKTYKPKFKLLCTLCIYKVTKGILPTICNRAKQIKITEI